MKNVQCQISNDSVATAPGSVLLTDHGCLNAYDGRHSFHYGVPRLSRVRRAKQLAVPSAKINSGGVELVTSHAVAQHGLESILLRQAICKRLPRFPSVACAIDAQLSFRRAPKLIRFERHNERGIRIVVIDFHREAEV